MQLQPRPTHLGMSLVWVAVVRRRGFHHGSRVMGDERQDIDQQKVCKQKCKCKFNMKELYNWISKSYLMSSYFLQIKKVTFFFFPFGSVWYISQKKKWHDIPLYRKRWSLHPTAPNQRPTGNLAHLSIQRPRSWRNCHDDVKPFIVRCPLHPYDLNRWVLPCRGVKVFVPWPLNGLLKRLAV